MSLNYRRENISRTWILFTLPTSVCGSDSTNATDFGTLYADKRFLQLDEPRVDLVDRVDAGLARRRERLAARESAQLREGERVLELGCGWGGFARHAATKYGCSVVAYNISSQKVAYARRWNAGLPVEIIQDDYRTATGEFDKVAAIGLCEHVG